MITITDEQALALFSLLYLREVIQVNRPNMDPGEYEAEVKHFVENEKYWGQLKREELPILGFMHDKFPIDR